MTTESSHELDRIDALMSLTLGDLSLYPDYDRKELRAAAEKAYNYGSPSAACDESAVKANVKLALGRIERDEATARHFSKIWATAHAQKPVAE